MDSKKVVSNLSDTESKLAELKKIIMDGITEEERPVISETISKMLVSLYEMRDIVDGDEDLDLQD